MAIKTLAIIAAEIMCCVILTTFTKIQIKADKKQQASSWTIIDGEFLILNDDPVEDVQ